MVQTTHTLARIAPFIVPAQAVLAHLDGDPQSSADAPQDSPTADGPWDRTREIAIAVNREFVDKVDDGGFARFNDTFDNDTLTMDGLIEAIRNGHAFTATHHHKRHPRPKGLRSRYRCAENFLSAQHLALDCDDRSLADLQADRFIAAHAAFLYTTASHTAEAPRSRAVFLLDEPVTDPARYRALAAALVAQSRVPADTHCTDPARVFYGSRGCQVVVLGRMLPAAALAETVRAQAEERQARQRRSGERLADKPELEEIRDALRAIPVQQDYDDWLHVLMAVHSAYPGEEGIALIEEWSPGDEGEVERKFASFNDEREDGYTIKTVFWLARQHGWTPRDTPATRRLAVPVPPTLAPARTPSSLDQVTAEIERRVREVLTGRTPAGSTLVITAPPGAGKTSAIAREVAALPPARRDKVWMLAPRHDLFGIELEDAGFRQVLGRNADNCFYSGQAEVLGRKGHSVDGLLCAKCALKRGCEYYDQFRGASHRFAALQLLYTSYPQEASVLVLDELTPGNLLEETEIPRAELIRLAGDADVPTAIRDLAHAAQVALKARAGAAAAATAMPLSGAPLLDALDTAAGGRLRDLVRDAAAASTPPTLPALTIQAVEALPPNSADRLITALRRELAWRDAGLSGGVLTLDPARGRYRLVLRRDPPSWLREKRLIILNATADPEVLLDLLERDRGTADIYDPYVPLPSEVEIVQLTDAFYGKTTLTKVGADGENASLANAVARVRAELDPALTTGLITFKDIKARVAGELGIPEERAPHYGAVTGRNDLQHLEQLVLLGTFSPPSTAVVEQARAIYAGRVPVDPQDKLLLTPYASYTTPDGQGLGIEVRAFRDRHIQALFREQREGAMLQAAHRLRLHRPNGRERIRLILASALPIDELPPTKVVRLAGDESEPDETTRKLLEAAEDLLSRDGWVTRRSLKEATGLHTSTVSRRWEKLVRRAGLQTERRHLKAGSQAIEVAFRPAAAPRQGLPAAA